MNSSVQSIGDANKEMHELPHVLPLRHHGNSETQAGLQHPSSQHLSHSVGQHHHQQHQSLSTSQASHQHRQQPSHQSVMSHPHQEPISPHHHQVSNSPHPHPQASMSPHPHPQASMQHLKHAGLSTSHNLELDHLKSQSTQSVPSSSLQLHSQGVNTSESVADIASSSQRPHICSTCQKGFRSKQQLVQHSLVHSNVRKYSCTYCDRSFKQLSHLQQHTRIHTVQKGTDKVEEQRSFRCQFCQRAFKQLIHLQQHTRLHTGEKPYACKYEDCDRAFAQLSNLQHHMRNHEEQVKKEVLRIYKCQICHRSYTNDSSLKAHTMKMHIHMKLPDDFNAEEQPVKKRRKKNKHMSCAPTMVSLEEGESSSKKDDSDVSSDDEHMALGIRKDHGLSSTMGTIPRNLMESLNQYERTLAAGMNGDKVHIDSGVMAGSTGSGSRDREIGRPASSLGLIGVAGVDSAFMSSQHHDVVERVAAAAAAAVSNQLLQSGQGLSQTTTTSTFQPHPQPAHSHLMDSQLRSQVQLGLPSLHDQYFSPTGPGLGMLSTHAHLLGPSPRTIPDLSTTSYPSTMVTLPSHTSSRPPSTLASPHHVSEALSFNH